jgi:hypothetical protein
VHVAAGAVRHQFVIGDKCTTISCGIAVNFAISAPVSTTCNLLAILLQRRSPDAKIRWTVEVTRDSRQP